MFKEVFKQQKSPYVLQEMEILLVKLKKENEDLKNIPQEKSKQKEQQVILGSQIKEEIINKNLENDFSFLINNNQKGEKNE